MNQIKRILFLITRKVGRRILKKRIWLISDREMSAGDNGEAFFRFLQDKDVDSVFAISKKSDDYERIKRIGRTVDYESLKYKLLLCIADCHCSSQLLHMENHVETRQIFLQHGVAAHDLSKMLKSVAHRNFYIITSCKHEYEYMISNNQIDREHIWLTGLSRFDFLDNKPQKIVGVLFTMRHRLVKEPPEAVKNSDFFKTIIRILNDPKVDELLRSGGYRLKLKLHPEMESIGSLLSIKDHEKIFVGSYKNIIEEADLLITDYSSIAFDFAYLKKPVLYYQFDGDEYFDNPFTSKGKYDYEKSGFGPVTNEYDSFYKCLEQMISNKCIMDDKYAQRADECFVYRDQNNCQRIYEKVRGII